MNAVTFERWMRRFLLIIVECLCVGTVIELYLEKHFKETNQLIPFALCALGFVSIVLVQWRPSRKTIIQTPSPCPLTPQVRGHPWVQTRLLKKPMGLRPRPCRAGRGDGGPLSFPASLSPLLTISPPSFRGFRGDRGDEPDHAF